MTTQLSMLDEPVTVTDEDELAPLWKDRERELKSIRRRRIEWSPELAWLMLRHDVKAIGGDA